MRKNSHISMIKMKYKSNIFANTAYILIDAFTNSPIINIERIIPVFSDRCEAEAISINNRRYRIASYIKSIEKNDVQRYLFFLKNAYNAEIEYHTNDDYFMIDPCGKPLFEDSIATNPNLLYTLTLLAQQERNTGINYPEKNLIVQKLRDDVKDNMACAKVCVPKKENRIIYVYDQNGASAIPFFTDSFHFRYAYPDPAIVMPTILKQFLIMEIDHNKAK